MATHFDIISKIPYDKGRNTVFRFFARALPINHIRLKPCPYNCDSIPLDEPYLHPMLTCPTIPTAVKIKAVEFIRLISGNNIPGLTLEHIYLDNPLLINTHKFALALSIILHKLWINYSRTLYGHDPPIWGEFIPWCVKTYKIIYTNRLFEQIIKFEKYKPDIPHPSKDEIISTFHRKWTPPPSLF